MLLKEFRKQTGEVLLSFLWRQWAQIGLASAAAEQRDGWAIDPEALLLLTCTVGRWDPRLFDEVVDWMHKNCRFLNIPRLRSLLKRNGSRGEMICSAIAKVIAAKNGRLNWRCPCPEKPPEAEPLFFDINGRPMGGFGPTDEVFLKFGFERGPIQLRGYSRQFNAVMPESALLRLRSLFGVSARAEITLYLATHKMAHPSGIAKDTGFSQKNIQDTLVDMTASGIVHTAALEGRKKSYFIHSKDLSPFLYDPDNPPAWVTWPPLFSALEELWLTLQTIDKNEPSPLLLSSDSRRLMKSIRPRIEASGFGECLSNPESFPGEQYADIFQRDIRRLLGLLNREAE